MPREQIYRLSPDSNDIVDEWAQHADQRDRDCVDQLLWDLNDATVFEKYRCPEDPGREHGFYVVVHPALVVHAEYFGDELDQFRIIDII